jgi:glucose/arabinose dehydrogenase
VRLLELNEKNEVISEEILFEEIGKRIRNIITLANGELMIITDKKNGQLIKVKKI